MRGTVPLLLLLFLPWTPALAQGFDRLAFMQGCWEGQMADESIVEEIWTKPSKTVMLGMTRYLDKGREHVSNWEFTFIERTDSTVFFVPTTHREQPDTFWLSMLGSEVAAWSRTGDDFPATIMYRRTADGSNIARLEPPRGSTNTSMELRFRRVKCPGE